MSAAWKAFAGLAALLHCVFFLLESVLFSRPDVMERFRVDPNAANDVLQSFAFNQGFYNLFLALGCFVGLALIAKGGPRARDGHTLVVYSCAIMLGAGLVLVASVPELAGAALVQAGPPALALGLRAAAGEHTGPGDALRDAGA